MKKTKKCAICHALLQGLVVSDSTAPIDFKLDTMFGAKDNRPCGVLVRMAPHCLYFCSKCWVAAFDTASASHDKLTTVKMVKAIALQMLELANGAQK